MKILSAAQIRQADEFTIQNEPISSLDLMERAATVFTHWFITRFPETSSPVHIFCGPGNNGGDGAAVARLLFLAGYHQLFIYQCWPSPTTLLSEDLKSNLERLVPYPDISIATLGPNTDFPALPDTAIIVDAIFGSGLNRAITGYLFNLIQWINQLENTKIAIDVPSGLLADQHSDGACLKADYTFSFELPKLAFLFPENSKFVGNWTVKSILLHPEFIANQPTDNFYLEEQDIKPLLKKRNKFDHKGTFGHSLIIGGSYGKIGAALLASKACLRSGSGLVTVYVPPCGYSILQTALPEAMVLTDPEFRFLTQLPDLKPFNAIGIGCGIGQQQKTAELVLQLLQIADYPLVLDADALNIISQSPNLLTIIPPNSILTPHPKEFERLFGPTANDFERQDLQRRKSMEFNLFIILKGAHTCITTPDGRSYFNSTGNPGMATGGSGDVLTGILTALLAQRYSPLEACMAGVFMHGLAGDLAAHHTGEISMTAGDLVDYIGKAFQLMIK